MDRESVERLRFDRRLRRRSGWLSAADEEAYLASLPDVSDKMTTIAEEEEKAAEEKAAATDPAGESRPAMAPTAGDFSTPSPFGAGAGGGFDGPANGG